VLILLLQDIRPVTNGMSLRLTVLDLMTIRLPLRIEISSPIPCAKETVMHHRCNSVCAGLETVADGTRRGDKTVFELGRRLNGPKSVADLNSTTQTNVATCRQDASTHSQAVRYDHQQAEPNALLISPGGSPPFG